MGDFSRRQFLIGASATVAAVAVASVVAIPEAFAGPTKMIRYQSWKPGTKRPEYWWTGTASPESIERIRPYVTAEHGGFYIL